MEREREGNQEKTRESTQRTKRAERLGKVKGIGRRERAQKGRENKGK